MWNVKCENVFKHVQNNVTIAKFASNLTANICLLLKSTLFFLSMTLNKLFYEIFFGWKSLFHFFVVVLYYTFLQEWLHSNVADRNLSGAVVVLEVQKKLTCGSSFCNAGGCKTQISMELGCNRELYLERLSRAILQISVFKVPYERKPPRMFWLACNLLKMDAYSNDFEKIFLAKKVFLAKNPCN